ncbi:hypothetical protein OIU84_027216 [Salix udensis]|uniref:Peptidase metallopeptidase domain-containing protein n=1 Tax=Salix udensis TaxID=889485 RepID=A0AAD6KEV5_9ROSI|nr:hypothetical protein OIU84_027216 [Salix udensis]
MAPKLSHLLLAILVIFSIQTFKSRARTLKPEHQQSFGSFLQKLEGVQKGQAAEGLLDLKKYLKKFGYYPSDATLTSSDFDDHLELALKAYQKFYRLNVTGNLDSSTTQQMMIPRCGVPDIINPPPSTEPSSTESKHKKFHMVAHYAFGSNKWPPSKYALTYTFGPGLQVFDLNTLRSVCADAFQKWAQVTSFTFTEAADGASADIVIAFYRGDHGDGKPFDGPGNVLAHDENWSTDPAMDQIDLESVSVHEMGHLLGLYHSTDRESIMYPSLQIGTKKRDLTQDDIDGIHALYPN